jgi:hypothetical protein
MKATNNCAHLANFLAAYNFARRLTLRGLTPHEYVCKISTNNPALQA